MCACVCVCVSKHINLFTLRLKYTYLQGKQKLNNHVYKSCDFTGFKNTYEELNELYYSQTIMKVIKQSTVVWEGMMQALVI
jgi:hypothetical protein